jgi:hypothetical protein
MFVILFITKINNIKIKGIIRGRITTLTAGLLA